MNLKRRGRVWKIRIHKALIRVTNHEMNTRRKKERLCGEDHTHGLCPRLAWF